MFKIRKSTMLHGNPIADLLGHPVVLCSSILIGLAQTAHYLQRPVPDLPQALEYVAMANWVVLLLYAIGYLACASMRAIDWALVRTRSTAERLHARTHHWPWFSLELAALLTCIAVSWTAGKSVQEQPITDKNIAACAGNLQEPGLRHLAHNLKPSTTQAEFSALCGESFLKDRMATPKRPESREELLRRFGPQ